MNHHTSLFDSLLIAARPHPGQKGIPSGWRSPWMDSQLSLFPVDADIALPEATGSRDEIARWQAVGWSSDALLADVSERMKGEAND